MNTFHVSYILNDEFRETSFEMATGNKREAMEFLRLRHGMSHELEIYDIQTEEEFKKPFMDKLAESLGKEIEKDNQKVELTEASKIFILMVIIILMGIILWG